MKKLIFATFLMSVSFTFYSCCDKEFKQMPIDQQVDYLTSLESSHLSKLFYKVDSIQQKKINQSANNFTGEFNKGNPIGFDIAQQYTNNYKNYFWWRMDKDSIEKSVYFKKTEIDSLWNAIRLSQLQGEQGIRVYFARYDETISDPKLEDKMTAVLRACVNTKDLAYSENYNVAYNFGDLCPKICGNHINRDRGGDYPEDK